MKRKARQTRTFSEELKKKIVKEIEQSKATLAQTSREYQVSISAIYKWLHKYSSYLQKGAKLVVELNSEGYRSKALEIKVKELEAVVGRKQMEIDFLDKLIELADGELEIDIKKKLYIKPSTGFDVNKSLGNIK